ncbi:MAG: hypothetical protein B7Y86_03195 [Brevundimonas subvibrioides]|uniref:Uncharacterized protein n=1 Tax=Brevundimonas subvibrioides TaxID=74313 RepID=A0A258HNY7_9CAUL|nr:toprim domain-containing protein [Brevundimonas subvibrioides]OYX58033.1 MAG: hypothetical protein B7Y86_03195 [Brevundimonas subvibrioides]
MTLHAIVAAFGGDLYQGGRRANVPAPGHSAHDRSVSLLLSEGRVVIHGFGAADWREMRDLLRSSGFIDDAGRLTGAGQAGASPPRPNRQIRSETARRLWDGGVALASGDPASRHLRRRAVVGGHNASGLRFHPSAPISVYREGSRSRPALVAQVSDADDALTAVEITYLEANGLVAAGLTLSRKTVGIVPPGAAVRLSPSAAEMLVGEGVMTTLSAIERFQLPGWALMSANNLAVWVPPPEVQRLLIAADSGAVGQGAADRLRRRLVRTGINVRILWPDPPLGDWNEVACAVRKRGERGR